MAGEIHDTLAQGFTSIVLLARAGRRPTIDTGESPRLHRVHRSGEPRHGAATRRVESAG